MKKTLLFWITTLLFPCSIRSSTDPANDPPVNSARLLLSRLRGGDYAHAGDKEAVDLVFEQALRLSPEILEGPCLDVGSGLGGTAEDLRGYGLREIYGVDPDPGAVAYARKHYPEVTFLIGSASDVPTLFPDRTFSFIYLLNVLYAVEDHRSALDSLYAVSKPGGVLAIFDYTNKGKEFSLTDLGGKPMHPIPFESCRRILEESGWEVREVADLSTRYIGWYEDLLDKLSKEESLLSQEFSQQDLDRVRGTFETLRIRLQNGALGGVLILAQRAPE